MPRIKRTATDLLPLEPNFQLAKVHRIDTLKMLFVYIFIIKFPQNTRSDWLEQRAFTDRKTYSLRPRSWLLILSDRNIPVSRKFFTLIFPLPKTPNRTSKPLKSLDAIRKIKRHAKVNILLILIQGVNQVIVSI